VIYVASLSSIRQEYIAPRFFFSIAVVRHRYWIVPATKALNGAIPAEYGEVDNSVIAPVFALRLQPSNCSPLER